MRQSFLEQVKRFEACQPGAEPSETGLCQFHDFESQGLRPAFPDPYFERLLDGKKWWEWTLNLYAKQYGTADWPGWTSVKEDFKNDPAGFRQVKQRVGVA